MSRGYYLDQFPEQEDARKLHYETIRTLALFLHFLSTPPSDAVQAREDVVSARYLHNASGTPLR